MLYSVNHDINGAKSIEDTTITLTKEDQLLLVLGESTNDKLYEYYTFVTRNIIEGCRVLLIMVGGESKIRKQICMLMATYHRYDIYCVDSAHIITEEYVRSLLTRRPSLSEVQEFIGGDISAYAEVNRIVLGIERLVESADIPALKAYIEENYESIKQFTEIVDYMKRVVDTTNSGEYTNSINSLKSALDSAKVELDTVEAKLKKADSDKSKLTEDNSTMKKDIASAKAKITDLEQQVGAKTPVIKSYSEVNTTLIRCHVPTIMYFKEISPIPYIKSLVVNLYQTFDSKKLRVKLLIYDQKTGLSAIYGSLPVIGSAEYINNRDSFISQVAQLVVVEPNQTIVQDILQFDKPPYDVVIIYDKLRQVNDIVTGNNVYKFWVANSLKEAMDVQPKLKIDLQYLITRPEENADAKHIHIAKIADYKGGSTYSKLSKYNKLSFGESGNTKLLVKYITSRCKIEL